VSAREHVTNADLWRRQFCCRCGQLDEHCPHLNCATTFDAEHAARIKARYAIGKRFDPNHDTADYTDLMAGDAVNFFLERSPV
jgi:hypothetical protein